VALGLDQGASGDAWGYNIDAQRVTLAAAGLLVLECEQPARRQRRGKGKSDAIDAHLAVLAALRLDAGRLPVPRADGDREGKALEQREVDMNCISSYFV